MAGKFTKKKILEWTTVILDSDNEIIRDIESNWKKYKKIFIEKLAENLYEEMHRTRIHSGSTFHFDKRFELPVPDEKSRWYNYASDVPAKLKLLNLFIRPSGEYFRTCIITDPEIEKLVSFDHERFLLNNESDVGPDPELVKPFFRELNLQIPLQLKKLGFEVIHAEENQLSDKTFIIKLARAIHARYLQEMRKQDQGDSENKFLMDFDELPGEIRYSNIDSAAHIPAKLLSIGYKMKPIQAGFKSLTLHLDEDEIETMAKVEHLRWCWDKRLNGWVYGRVKDNSARTHPGLIPYEELSEMEKEKDRKLVRLIPALLQDIGYIVYPVVPGTIRNLSYAIKPQSSISKLLNETRKLNEEIRDMSIFNPVMEDKVKTINRKIEETIAEVQGNYNYAKHIQETFLPEDLYVREFFPESFILFKPKDIVSGDFYFFSRQNNIVVFAAADCTGHGIPGALLSILGYGLTDQAVNELRITDPPEILQHLYSRVHRFMRRDEIGTGLSDDMDIFVCSLDLKTRILTYSGVNNPLYLITGGELVEYKATNFIDNCSYKANCLYTSNSIRLKEGDTIYLFSDGYTDQFGGMFHKKYQRNRFRSFLLSIKEYSMPEQRDRLYEEIEQWREENDEDQTDDILVIGIRI